MTGELLLDFETRFRRGPRVRAAWRMPADRFAVTVLFGPSGCGKSTTIRVIAGLTRPDLGTVRFGPETWSDAASGVFLPPQQRRVGVMFQDYALFPHLTVGGNVGYGVPRAERRTRVPEVLELLGVAGLEARFQSQLSGGEQQRVALARVLATRPRLLLLDEPLAALDGPTRDRLRPDLRRLLAGFGVPVVVVTHDRTEAIAFADQIVVMHAGTVLQAGPAADVFARPADPTVAQIVGTETVLSGEVVRSVDGVATVRVGTCEVQAADPGAGRGSVVVCLRGEDVTLSRVAVADSARNHWPATVTDVLPEGPLVRVRLDAGFPLTALVTRPAAAELSLAQGVRVVAAVKATAVHLIPRGS